MDEIIRKAKFLSELYEEELKRRKDQNKQEPITSGTKELDDVIKGFYPGELIIIAARPAMGKTTYLLQALLNISKKVPVLFYSLEHNKSYLMNKIIRLSKDQERRPRKDELTRPDMNDASMIERLMISDKKIDALEELMLLITYHVVQDGIKVVAIDYLQQLPETYSRLSKLEILKEHCKTLGVTLVLVSTVSPACESRNGSKRPRQSDVNFSNSLMDYVDVLLLLFRAEYYGIMEDRFGNDTTGKLEVIIAKCREDEYPDFSVEYRFDENE